MDAAALPRFARTKIQPPRLRAATLVTRPTLEPRLREALLTQRLVLVCSPLELVTLRQSLPAETQLVTPGIRGPADTAGDQKRTLSAKEALSAGANWLVIGRPIYDAANPREAAEAILRSLG